MSVFPLQAYMDRFAGDVPVVGQVEFGYDEFGRVVPLVRRGVKFVKNRCGDELGGDEDAELGAMDDEDAEIDELGAASEDESLAGLDDRIERLEAKLNKKQVQLSVETRPRVQRRLRRQISRISDNLGKLKAKANRKAARRGQSLPYAAAAGLAAGAGAGYLAAQRNQEGAVQLYDSQGRPVSGALAIANVDNLDVSGRYQGTQRAGREVRIPLKFAGALRAAASFPSSATAGSQVAFDGVTDSIPFAAFSLIGMEVTAWVLGTLHATSGMPDPSCQAQIVVTNLNARGNPNAFFDDQVIGLGGSLGSDNSKLRLEGVRNNDILRNTNTVRVDGYITNPFAIAATASMQVVISVEAILNVVEDDLFRPGPTR